MVNHRPCNNQGQLIVTLLQEEYKHRREKMYIEGENGVQKTQTLNRSWISYEWHSVPGTWFMCEWSSFAEMRDMLYDHQTPGIHNIGGLFSLTEHKQKLLIVRNAPLPSKASKPSPNRYHPNTE
ncbi:uncharacterized protein CLUP02_16661 [Colletotrichum lupini]|uniref:Uncharacterized protein n=1 Tax=Colletotrichum lupini TaxID=145971 RepID=A0A9Q8TA88_9PEZI|nr:uncharacterized protein CLUP02_16661 [Colletotrichum lupini]UQC91127.1 hypothetical protein CLUP02_16661 [Colletotrichum lupini]